MSKEVVTLVTMMGEFVGRMKEEDTTHYTITSPRMVIATEQGAGFAPSVAMTSEASNEVIFNKALVLTVVPTAAEAEKAWISTTSGIVL